MFLQRKRPACRSSHSKSLLHYKHCCSRGRSGNGRSRKKFSKVNSLLNVQYEKALELTFENVCQLLLRRLLWLLPLRSDGAWAQIVMTMSLKW